MSELTTMGTDIIENRCDFKETTNKIQFYLNWILDAECVIASTSPERDVLIHLASRDPFYRGMEDAQRVSSSSTTHQSTHD